MATLNPYLSIIIPTFNEEANLKRLAPHISAPHIQVIVSDGGSTDDTPQLARELGFAVVKSPKKGRGPQLNQGAKLAKAPVLFFLHADCKPPEGFDQAIKQTIAKGYSSGCFRLQFDWNHWLLSFSAYLTRFNFNAVRFGDQGFFVTHALWQQLHGYNTELLLMEDQDIVRRARKLETFKIVAKPMLTSARKYRANGALRLQWIYFNIWWRFYRGYPQKELLNYYRQKIVDDRQ